MATPKKSANISSTTGRMPSTAAPTPRPMKAVSEIGVSSTRSGPNWSSSPVVAPKIPPYFPMSSPRTKTSASRSISCAMPSAMARAVVSRRPAAGALAGLVAESVTLISSLPSREDVVPRRLGRRNGTGLGELDRPLDPGGRLGADGADGCLVEHAGRGQARLVRRDGIPLRYLRQFGAVGLRVALEVTPQPQRVHFEQGRSLAGPGPRHRITGGRVDGFDVVVLDPLARHAVGG